MFQYVLFN